jgi:DNA-binding PadR family transcriptional regulator
MVPVFNLGEFEQLVLLATLRLGDEAYGVTIRAEILEHAGRTIAPGALYTALDRLEDKGLVTSRIGEPTLGSTSFVHQRCARSSPRD